MQLIRFAPFAFALAAPLAVATAQSDVPAASDLKPVPAERGPGFESIQPELCKEWLTYLASDELRGRATGTPGYKLAAEFVAAGFKEWGLKPVGDDESYFQHVPFVSVGPSAGSYLAITDGQGKEIIRVVPDQGLGGNISENSDREVEIVCLVVKSADDIEEADLEGKAILMFSEVTDRRERREVSVAISRARAIALRVDDAASAGVRRRVTMEGGRSRVQRGRGRRPNDYAVSTAVANKMREAIDKLGAAARLKVSVEIAKGPAFGANVVGFLEGSDPELKKQIVGVGSHLDHIGARGESINNGADDDGSGTTGVLAVARAFATNPHKPKRSLLFMCFAGEEMGLLGSRYYVNNPIFPNENMVAEIQMDMIGRNEESRRSGEKAEDNLNSLHLIGTEKLSKDLHNVCLELNKAHVGFDFEFDEEDVFYRSDHANFARKDIPIAFLFTGFHGQYHRPDDTVEKIDFPKLARVAQLAYAVAFEVADRDKRIVRDRLFSEISRRR